MNKPLSPLAVAIALTGAFLFCAGFFSVRSGLLKPQRRSMVSTMRPPPPPPPKPAILARLESPPLASMDLDAAPSAPAGQLRLPIVLEKENFRLSLIRAVDGKKLPRYRKPKKKPEYEAGWCRVFYFLCERTDKAPLWSWTPHTVVIPPGAERYSWSASYHHSREERPAPDVEFCAWAHARAAKIKSLFPPLQDHQIGICVSLSDWDKPPLAELPRLRFSLENWRTEQGGEVEFESVPVPPRNKHCTKPDCRVSNVTTPGLEVRNGDDTVRIEKMGYRYQPKQELALVVTTKLGKQSQLLKAGFPYPTPELAGRMGSAADNSGASMTAMALIPGDTFSFVPPESFQANAVQSLHLQPPAAGAKTFRLKFPVYQHQLVEVSPKFELVNFPVEDLVKLNAPGKSAHAKAVRPHG